MAISRPLTDAVQGLLAEAVRGDGDGTTWISDGHGLLATVRNLDARQASRGLPDGGATIAGHVEHVRWFLDLLNAFARGERPEIAWNRSWTVREVDDGAWRTLQGELERAYEELHGHFGRGLDPQDEQRLMPILATVAHAAYHLGAVRQMARAVR